MTAPPDEEAEQITRYERRIELQRQLGRATVGLLLDEMCTDLGLDPVTTWRIPHAEETRDEARRHMPTGSKP